MVVLHDLQEHLTCSKKFCELLTMLSARVGSCGAGVQRSKDCWIQSKQVGLDFRPYQQQSCF